MSSIRQLIFPHTLRGKARSSKHDHRRLPVKQPMALTSPLPFFCPTCFCEFQDGSCSLRLWLDGFFRGSVASRTDDTRRTSAVLPRRASLEKFRLLRSGSCGRLATKSIPQTTIKSSEPIIGWFCIEQAGGVRESASIGCIAADISRDHHEGATSCSHTSKRTNKGSGCAVSEPVESPD